MYKSIVILLFLFNQKCCHSQNVEYPIYFAEDFCDKSIKIGSEPTNSSLIIRLLKTNSSLIKSCKVSIESSNDQQIHTNIKHMIDSYKAMHITSRNSITFTKLNHNRLLIIEFNGLGDNIHLIITSYKAVDDNQLCPKSYFLCEQNKCIHEIYRCDSYANCDNDENDFNCAQVLTPGNTVLLTIILGILCSLFGTTCLLFSYVFCKYYQQRDKLLDTKQSLYGTVNTSLPLSGQHSLKVYK